MKKAFGTRRSRGAMRRAGAKGAPAPLIARDGVDAAPLRPFMLPRKKPATAVEGSLLRLRLPPPAARPAAPPDTGAPETRR